MNSSGAFRLRRMAVHTALLGAMLLAGHAHAAADLQLAYDVQAKSARATVEPVARPGTDVDTPLRLELELTLHVERVVKVTEELRAIVETMPGPALAETTSLPPQTFSSPLDETLTRLNHVEQLVADIGRIIADMPVAVATAPPNVMARPPQSATPVPAPSPAPPPRPIPEPDTPLATTTVRTLLLVGGGLIAAILARYLRRRYLRKRPSARELAASIEPPPLRDEAIELADVMTAMGLADGAAQALVERIRANPRQSLSYWLKLLDVYRKTGQKKQFEKASEEMRKTFNVKSVDWQGEEEGSQPKPSLESYPHIATQLKKLWPTTECTEYLLSLLADTREGKRSGFPLSVIEEIVLLLAVLRSEEFQK